MRFLVLILAVTTQLQAGEMNSSRAEVNYMINCQGCHSKDGSGVAEVPTMKGYLANFLKVPGGREFLVRVPGSANAPLNNVELAETLNWMLNTFSKGQLREDFLPYSADEVGKFRENALIDVISARTSLVKQIDQY